MTTENDPAGMLLYKDVHIIRTYGVCPDNFRKT
jgi:hypothetical protein